MQDVVEALVALVPVDWWPLVNRYAVVALAVLVGCALLVRMLDALDMRDGKRDVPILSTVAPWAGVVADFVTAVLDLGVVKLPSLARWRPLWLRVRALLAAPHPDDDTRLRGDP